MREINNLNIPGSLFLKENVLQTEKKQTRNFRGKLKSRTGHWSVRDFNFLEFYPLGRFLLLFVSFYSTRIFLKSYFSRTGTRTVREKYDFKK